MAETIVKTYQLNIDGIDSVEDLRNAINELNEAIKKLDSTTKEYEETLSKLNQLQDKLKEAMGGVTDSFKEGKESIESAKETIKEFNEAVVETTGEEGLEGMKTKVEEVVSTNTELDDSLTKQAESMKELRNQIKLLKDRLVQLDEGTDAYTETVAVLVEKQRQLNNITSATKRDNTALEGSYDALAAKMSALRKEWKSTTDEAKRAELGKQIADINAQLKSMDASIGNFQRNVGDYRNALKDVFLNPRQQIKMLREELARLEEGTEEYNATLMRLTEVTTQQRKLNEQLRYSSTDLEDIFKNTAGVIGSVAGGFSALNGMMNLFGEGNDDIQKAMLKTQSLIAIVQGMNGLAGLKDKLVGLIDGMKGFASRFGMLNKSTKEFSENAKAVATETERATGSLDAQAGAASKLGDTYDRLSEKERNSVSYIDEEIAKREASIALLEKEIDELQRRVEIGDDSLGTIKEYEGKQDEARKLQEEIDALKELKKERLDSSDARNVENGVIDETIVKLEEELRAYEKTIEANEENIAKRRELAEENRVNIEDYERYLEILQQNENADQSEIERLKRMIALNKDELETNENLIASSQREIKIAREKQAQAQKELASKQQLFQKNQQLNAQLKGYNKMQILSIASTKLEIASTNALANSNMFLATTTKVASVALKGLKAALISTGIGALLVLLGEGISLIGKGFKELFNWIRGTEKHKEALASLNSEIERMNEAMEFNVKIMQARGVSTYKVMAKEITNLSKTIEKQAEAVDYAKEHFNESSDEVKDAVEALDESLKSQSEKSQDAIVEIEKLMADVEKADRQKGMTQLEKDMDDLNTKFSESIGLIRTMQEEGLIASSIASNYIQRLTKDWELAIGQAKEKNASGKTHTEKSEWEKQKEEAEKLYKEMEEQSKTEEQKLRDKYEKQKKLLEKFHLDTTKLTEKYYKDLDKLMTERNKASYDKWKAHLEAELTLMQNQLKDYEYMVGSTNADAFAAMVQKGLEDEVPVMEKEIENLVNDFEYMFGSIDSPFEELFDIQQLDEAGSRAITITQDIAESMKELGLDPTNIEDIETMIDKWKLDKKAIDDANKELVKYKSNIKMAAYEAANDRIEVNLDRMTESVETEYEVLSTETAKFAGLFKGWYEGLSPEQQEEQFRMRYQVLETGLQQEYDLWKKAAEDETLTIEDRNTAIANLNAVVMRQNQTAAQKTIDANNLVIKSFQRVSTALSSMATNIAGIMGTVSDAIMDSANAQLNAGKITEKAYAEQFEKAKAFQIAQATINTIAGAVGAFMGITKDTGGFGVAAAALEAAAILAAGWAQIQQIRNTKPETSGSGGGGGGGNTNAFSLPNVLVGEPPRSQNLTSQSDIDALANALGDRMNDQRVYILESDISNSLEKSNKRKTQVSF